MQHQPKACASDLGDDQSRYLWPLCNIICMALPSKSIYKMCIYVNGWKVILLWVFRVIEVMQMFCFNRQCRCDVLQRHLQLQICRKERRNRFDGDASGSCGVCRTRTCSLKVFLRQVPSSLVSDECHCIFYILRRLVKLSPIIGGTWHTVWCCFSVYVAHDCRKMWHRLKTTPAARCLL